MGGELVLVFDDGYATDYREVLPVLREADAPACIAVVPEWLGSDGHLSGSQLTELRDDGCELVAHGRRHRDLRARRLASAPGAGDDRIHVDGTVYAGEDHGVYPGDEFELTDGRRAITVDLAGTGEDEAGEYVELATPLADGFNAGDRNDDVVLRPTTDLLEDEIGGVREAFATLGSEPSAFVFPYDAVDPRSWAVAASRYDVVPNADVGPLPNRPDAGPRTLRRRYLQTTHATRTEIGTYLDATAECEGVAILAGHSAWDSVPPARVAWVLEAARERAIEVTTFRDSAVL